MKKYYVIFTMLIFLTTITQAALGEVVTDTWYDIDKTTPYMEGYTTQSDDYKEYRLEYFQNDQTYVRFRYNSEQPSIKYLDFSYLFDCGFFIASNNTESNGEHFNSLSPGYKIILTNDDYLAVSLNYDLNENEINYYEIQFESYPENMKICSFLFIPTDGKILGAFYLNYRIVEELVVSGSIIKADLLIIENSKLTLSENYFIVGSTWTPSKFIIDNQFLKYDNEFNYFISGMYKFNSQFRAGLGYNNLSEQFCIKANFGRENSNLKFFYNIENKDRNILASYDLAYLIKF